MFPLYSLTPAHCIYSQVAVAPSWGQVQLWWHAARWVLTGKRARVIYCSLWVCCCKVCFCVSCPAGTHFKRLIPDDGPAGVRPEKVKRVIFCTGKIYYEVTRERKNRGMDDDVAVVRIEQVTLACRRTQPQTWVKLQGIKVRRYWIKCDDVVVNMFDWTFTVDSSPCYSACTVSF